MFDLGTSFLASVIRDPDAEAIVDGSVRLTYREWYQRISAVVAELDHLGLRPGDHVLTLLQNRWEAATLHWACQFANLILTPLNWRAKGDEIEYVLKDANIKLLAYEDVAEEALAYSPTSAQTPRLRIGTASGDELDFAKVVSSTGADASPRASAEDWSLMLYTSGTTSWPKGVPRRHRAERAAAIAHVAQNLYRHGERTLGVMPLYHTMGVRSLLSMSLLGGCFACLPRFDVPTALKTIQAEKITNLYLVPTLYHDMANHADFADTDISSVRKLGFAGAPMTDGLLQKLQKAFNPDLFVNHYGSSEVYTCTINQNAVHKPGSAGRAALNQMIRVARMTDAEGTEPDWAAPKEEGEILALMSGDEAFQGYWNRPDADAKSIRGAWYRTGDTGYFDEDGDLFVTGRVDDMIITGGENVSPVEIESQLSLHPAVSEVAVVGLPDERWGRVVTAFVKRAAPVEAAELDQFCRESGLANFKRPRKILFVEQLPRSPVGKLLRRKLVEGEYRLDPTTQHQDTKP